MIRDRLRPALCALFASGATILLPAVAAAERGPMPPPGYTDQLIVTFDASARTLARDARGVPGVPHPDRMLALSEAGSIALSHLRVMGGGSNVLKLPQPVSEAEAVRLAARLAGVPGVLAVEPDRVFTRRATTPNDTLFANQWALQAPASFAGASNATNAWDITTGNAGVRVAILDTGAGPTQNPDLSRINTALDWDFVDDDADASDTCPSLSEIGEVSHGMHVTGILGATSNNAAGIAGMDWASTLIPVRVLDCDSGFLSDIADGLRWAAGHELAGVTVSAPNAHVVNMSLGADGACGATMQAAVNAARAAGAAVVVAAGNEARNLDTGPSSPASCSGVITVAAATSTGARASYSNFGTAVDLAAPGGIGSDGNDATVDGVLSTVEDSGDLYQELHGTSMATPHVSGAASLMIAASGAKRPSPTTIENLLKSSARPAPSCPACGAGLLDARLAVDAVVAAAAPSPTLTAAAAATPTPVAPGAVITLDGAGSTVGQTYAWTQMSGNTGSFANAAALSTTMVTPNTPSAVPLKFQLTVTSAQGFIATSQASVAVTNVPPTVPALVSQATIQGNTLNFLWPVTDANGVAPVVTVDTAASTLPVGAVYEWDPASSYFRWFNAAPIGSYTVVFNVTDGEDPGITSSHAVTLNVTGQRDIGGGTWAWWLLPAFLPLWFLRRRRD